MEKILTTNLDERIATLSPAKRALLERYLQEKSIAATPALSIPKRDPSAPLPLSFSQQRLWFLEQLQPGLTAYNNTSTFRLNGLLNVQALQQSLTEILRRHESLRTTFTLINGEPQQVINPPCIFPLPIEDLSQLPMTQWTTEIEQRVTAENQRPFKLTQDLMRRAQLLRFREQEHVLILTSHHIASDAWSTGIFWRELRSLYGAFSAGKSSPLPDLLVQYADYTIWQRQSLQGQSLEKQLAYWRQQLAHMPLPLLLPTKIPTLSAPTMRGAQHIFQIDRQLTDGLRALSRGNGVTLFMTLLASFQTLLYRYTGQEDMLIGTPIAGRNQAEIEDLIGFFVNTLVLRGDITGNPTFRVLLQRVRKAALSAYEHQELPFEKLVDELAPERHLNRHPIIQVTFALQNTPHQDRDLPGLSVQPLATESKMAKFDLSLFLTETTQGLTGRIEYAADLFEPATIQRMADHFYTLVASIVDNPDQCVGVLSMLTAAERHQLLVEWNQTQADYPRQSTIHTLFEAQVKRTPDAVALSFAGEQLSYGALNARANQLAHYLRQQGGGADTIVGICLERSLEWVIGLLAILKIGAAYLPLDPDDPPARLAAILESAQSPLLLTETARHLPIHSPTLKQICLDSARLVIDQASSDNLPTIGNGDSLAYVMYTSGSTGRPKGVAIPHRAVNRLVINTNYIALDAHEVIAQAANCAFDATTFEVWGALLHGARLVILPKATVLAPQALVDSITHYGITTIFLTTALLKHVVQTIPNAFQNVRNLLFGGEAVDPQSVAELLRAGPPTHLLHVYGPTEATTFTTWHPVREVVENARTVPIGRPIANTQVYILDQNAEPVPVGVGGELYAGGDGVAQGYLNQPGATAEKFIANPFGAGRLYKTGDRARFLADGNIEFIGRTDFQVKIRGFRIEMGEIEFALHQHPALKTCVVVVHQSAKGDKQIIAYCVPAAPATVTSDELAQFLRQRLPVYMLPAVFVILDNLPLNASGKLNRAALPAPYIGMASAGQTRQVARDPLEFQLVRLWEAVLGKHPISIQDNFFALGGHSLLAVQLFDRITRLTGKNLPVATLFQAPTIEQLAAILRQADWKPTWESIVPMKAGGINPPLFLVPPAASTVLNFANLIGHLPADQPVYGLQYLGLTGSEQPHGSVEEMATYCTEQICKFQPEGPYLVGGICFGAHVALEIAQELQRQGKSVALLVLLDAGPPANGPTWRYPRRFTLDHFRTMAETWREEGVKTWLYRRLRYRFVRLRNFLKPRKKYFEDAFAVHLKAYTSYQGRPYRGRMLLIQSEEFLRFKYFHKRWAALASSVFEHVVIAGSSHRSVLLQADHTKLAAQKLMDSINQAIEQTP